MKRSTLVMTTALLSGAVFLSACNDDRNDTINFQTVSQCMQQRPAGEDFDSWEDICENAIENAKAQHERTAPRYAPTGSDGDDLCEEYHGDDQCYKVTDNNGNSFWMPFLMGYVVSSALDSSGKRYYTPSKSQPLYYSSKQKSYMTSTGSFTTAKAYGRSTVSSRALTPPKTTPKISTPTSVKSSGGFGASRSVSGGRSSFGS